jgi:hypothetical protein
MKNGYRSLIFVCLFLLITAGARAQNTADVVGTVVDASRAVVPGATVTITNTGTGVSQTATSTGSGDYAFNLLQVGTYSLKVEAKGFKTYSAPNITLSSGDRARVDAEMTLGDVSQTVEVSSGIAPALQTDTSTISTTVTSQAVEDIPLDGRNITKLVQLAPGVNQGQPNDLDSGSRPDDRRPTVEFSANGQTDRANNVLIDGMDNNGVRGSTILRPSVEAIQEVSIASNLYDASMTRVGGAAVDIITKAGTNSFHGSAFEFFRNKVLDTNPNYRFPVSNTAGVLNLSPTLPKPAFRQNQYGGSIGGPIRKNKTFFFGDFEKFSKALAIPVNGTVPTNCERGLAVCPDGKTQFGDFSDQPDLSVYGGGSTNCTPNTNVIAIGTCPYVVVPAGSITTIGRTYFNMYPLPTSPGLLSNYNANALATQGSTTFDLRFDHHFSDADTLFARYSFNDTTTLTPDAFPAVRLDPATGNISSSGVLVQPSASAVGGSNNFPGLSKERAQGVAISYVHVFSPSVVLNLKAGFDRLANNSLSLNSGSNAANKFFPCTATSCINIGPSSSGIPNIAMGGSITASGGASALLNSYSYIGDTTFLPIIIYSDYFQYMGALTWNKGPHSVRIGAQLIRRRDVSGQNVNGQGGFGFTGGFTGVPGADLLEGLGSGGLARNFTLVQPGLRVWEPGVYVQDDWRAKRWLTLNIGVRYDMFTPSTEKYGRIPNLSLANGFFASPSLPGIQQTSPTDLVKPFYGGISPRIGFAATLPHTVVLRGGFGISYFGGPTAPSRNPPFTFNFLCQPQNETGTNTPCASQFGSSATIAFGACPFTDATCTTGVKANPASSVGQTGGALFAAGAPVPVLSVLPVLPPTTCPASALPTSGGCSAAGGNQYATFGSISSIWPHQPYSYLEQYNLQVQKEFSGNVITLGYVGEFARHLGYSESFNTQNANLSQNPALTSLPLAIQNGFPWLAKNAVNMTMPMGTSSYNALQANFVRRFKGGLTANINYTWAHAMNNGNGPCKPEFGPANFGVSNGPKYSDPCYYDNVASPGTPLVVTNLVSGPGMIGNTSLDVPNRIAGAITYQLPFGKSFTGYKAVLVKDWSTNVAGSWQSGLPFGVGNAQPLSGVGGSVDQVCSGKLSNPTKQNYINEACFKQPTQFTYGVKDALQNWGPRQRSVDFSIAKDFGLTERLKMQFRAEIFNLFNTPSFAPPGGVPGTGAPSVNIPAFGSNGLGLAQNPSSPTSLNAGAITLLNPNFNTRVIQFGLKLLF